MNIDLSSSPPCLNKHSTAALFYLYIIATSVKKHCLNSEHCPAAFTERCLFLTLPQPPFILISRMKVYSIRIPTKVMVLIMKIIFSLLLSLLLLSSSVFAADNERWLLAGKDSPNNNSWYIDSRTLKIHDNSTVLFWAKVMLGDPKYDITEIKIKYLLSADRLQLTKLEEIGYSKAGETIWNNNVSKTISVIPGSGPEKLVLFVDDFVQKKTAEKTKQKAAAKQTENIDAAKAEKPEVKEAKVPAAKTDVPETTAAKADTSKNTETQNTDNSAEQKHQ
jgi:hypothetical protein